MMRFTIFIVLFIASLFLGMFVLFIGLAGGHRLYFSGAGGMITLIVLVITILPFICFLVIRKRLQKQLQIISGILSSILFVLSAELLFVGIPRMTHKFSSESYNCNQIGVIKKKELNISIELIPEMFERVGVHATIMKCNDVKISTIKVNLVDKKLNSILPVFKPIVWDSIQQETIQMQSFYESNEFTKMNRFSIWAQYPIEKRNSIKMTVDYSYFVGNEKFEDKKEYWIKISKELTFEKLIHYK